MYVYIYIYIYIYIYTPILLLNDVHAYIYIYIYICMHCMRLQGLSGLGFRDSGLRGTFWAEEPQLGRGSEDEPGGLGFRV